MDTIELKQSLLNSIKNCSDTDFLKMLQEIVTNFNKSEGELLAALSPEQKMQLEESVQSSYNTNELIDNSAAWKRLDQWL
jgi:hypothetical protein